MIEVVKKEDCVGIGVRKGHKRYNKVEYKCYRRGDIKRCFICGTRDDNRGLCWHEYYIRGRLVRHYLCKKCIDGRMMEYKNEIK